MERGRPVNPLVAGLVSGVLANALTALLAYTGRQAWGGAQKDIERALKDTVKRGRLVDQAADTLGGLMLTADHAKDMKAFLSSADMEGLVRRLFAAHISADSVAIGRIRQELTLRLSDWLRVPPGEIETASSRLHEALIQGCEGALHVAAQRGILAAYEATLLIRHRLIMSELQAMKGTIAALTEGRIVDSRAALEFESKYRQQLSIHGYITPPHFDVPRRVPIDRLYVAPSFLRVARRKDERWDALSLRDFLQSLYRVVLIGNPGGGKSTLSQKICYDLAIRHGQRAVGGRALTPILVVLRDYGAQKAERRCSILQFIESVCNSKYQLPALQGAFEALLSGGRGMVVFDGLDELLDTSFRQEISADVEAFCKLYPSVPVLVTSREVGYYEAPLDERAFSVYRLSPFEDSQAREYATKWFALDSDLPSDQRVERAEAFLRESLVVPDLRSNPLMLALMCNIYRGEGYIPRNRPEVYEKCALMLFERWDKGRHIMVPLPFESHIGPTMKYLAHWIYANPPLQSGVTERQLISEASRYLLEHRFEQQDEAQQAAREFIQFCRNRAWVFTDMGTTKSGEKLYQFTHRTFLEYFTACYIVRSNSTPERLFTLLKPRIEKSEWDVVAQLAFQLMSRNVEGAGDSLLMLLLEETEQSKRRTPWNLLLFATRCLEFTVPRPTTVRIVADRVVRSCLLYPLRSARHHMGPEMDVPTQALQHLLLAAPENRRAVTQAISAVVRESLSTGNDARAPRCLDLLFSLEFVSGALRGVPVSLVDEWVAFSAEVLGPFAGRVRQVCRTDRGLCEDAVWHGIVSLPELLDWHGPGCILASSPHTTLPVARRVPLAFRAAFVALGETGFGKDRLLIAGQVLESLGHASLTEGQDGLPSVDVFTSNLLWYLMTWMSSSRPQATPAKLSRDAFFGLFVLLAVASEDSPTSDLTMLDQSIRALDSPADVLIPLLRARVHRESAARLSKQIRKCGFTDEQQALVRKWVQGDVSLHPGRKRSPE